jgi:hypothetical protein
VNGLRLHVQGRALEAVLALLLASSAAFAQTVPPPETSPSLAAARELFLEATNDFDAGRAEVALAKFKKVAEVRETAQVRFNIAKSEAALGRVASALVDFELADREAPSDSKGDALAKLAREQAALVRAQVPRLTITQPPDEPPGLAVTLDGHPIGTPSLGEPIPVDPGDHVVEATAPGRASFRRDVHIDIAQAEQVTIELGPPSTPPPQRTEPLAPPPSPGVGRPAWGYVAVGAGVVFVGISTVFVLLENGAVSDIKSSCPDTSHCSASKQGVVQDARSAATRDEVLSIGFGAGALVALGIGAYLLFSPSAPSAAPASGVQVMPAAPGANVGASLVARY